MPVPATTGQLKTNFYEMKIGDYIACNYRAYTSGSSGTFSNFGEVYDEIPIHGSTTPDGTFYFIKVDNGLFIADRIVQHSISWNTLNTNGLIEGYEWKDGLSFNGTNSNVSIGYSPSLSPSSAITVRIDVYMSNWNHTNKMNLLSRVAGYGFSMNDGNNIPDIPDTGYISFYVRIGTNLRGVGIPLSYFDNNKHYSLAGSFDGQYIKFYVNGELKSITDIGSKVSMAYGSGNILTFGSNNFQGNIYNVAVWDRALSDQEVMIQHETKILNYKDGLVGYWDFKQVFNNKLYDLIGSNIGTINNCSFIYNSKKIKIRSLTGGVAYADANGNSSTTDQGRGGWPTNNEWDKYIVNFPTDKIQAGKTLFDVFHHDVVKTWTQDTPIISIAAATNRVTRGGTTGTNNFSILNSSTADETVGFRPVLEYKEV